jgi:hypothetical protein
MSALRFLLTTLLILSITHCDTYHVSVTGVSYHFTRQYRGQNYNEVNYGFGGGGMNSTGNNNFGVTAMYLKNSFNNDSAYVIGHYTNTYLRLGPFKNSTGVLLGIATGYGRRFQYTREQNPIPVAGLMNDTCLYDFCLFQVVMPDYDGMSGFWAMGGRYSFRL